MATIFTHALVAGAISVFSPSEPSAYGGKVPRFRLIASMVLLATIPDVDSLAFRYGIPYEDVFGHRGFTHSLIFSISLAVIVGLLVFRAIGIGSKVWWYIVFLLCLAGMSHGILDAFTDAGLGVGFFIPFDVDRYFFPWRPIDTSPVSIRAFFDGPAQIILLNEFVWVVLPVYVVTTVFSCVRFLIKLSRREINK